MFKGKARASAAIFGLSAGALLLATPAAAVPLTPGLTVTGEVDNNPLGAPIITGTVTNTGTAEIVAGGVLSTTPIAGATQTIDPFSDTLTDIGDGVGLVTTTTLSSTASGDRFLFDSNLSLVIMNTTAAPIDFKIMLDVAVTADADGPDSNADYDLDLENAVTLADLVLLSVDSDTLAPPVGPGDTIDVFVGGGPDSVPDPATAGALLSLIDSFMFPFTLAAGATLDLDAVIQWDARNFSSSLGGTITQDVFLSILQDPPPPNPMAVPAPASLPLLISGLLGLAYLTRRKRVNA